MPEPHESEQTKEPSLPEAVKPKQEAEPISPEALVAKDTVEPLLPQQLKGEEVTDALLPQELKPEEAKDALLTEKPEQEWIPGDQLELIRIPPPTIWPATVALGITGIAFGVVTHWILSMAGLFLFLLGAAGWIEDLRKDVL